MDITSRTHIAAAPDKVWTTVIDLRKLIDDVPAVLAITPADFAPVQGQKLTVRLLAQGREVDVPATLTTVTPPAKLVIDAVLPDPVGAPAEAAMTLTPASGGTDVQLSVSLKLGMLKELAAKAMIGGRGQAALDDALAQLKQRVEGS